MKAFQYSVNTIEPYNPTPSANLLIIGTLLQNLTITKGERKAYSSWQAFPTSQQKVMNGYWLILEWLMQ